MFTKNDLGPDRLTLPYWKSMEVYNFIHSMMVLPCLGSNQIAWRPLETVGWEEFAEVEEQQMDNEEMDCD